jgi:hypothetical protein
MASVLRSDEPQRELAGETAPWPSEIHDRCISESGPTIPSGFTSGGIGGIIWARPHLPAAAIRTPIKRPGLSTTVTCMPARSCAVSAIPTWRLNGNGVAGSILDPSLANARAAPHRVSRQPERPFSPPGACSCRTAPRLIFRNGGISAIGQRGNVPYGKPASGYRRSGRAA